MVQLSSGLTTRSWNMKNNGSFCCSMKLRLTPFGGASTKKIQRTQSYLEPSLTKFTIKFGGASGLFAGFLIEYWTWIVWRTVQM